MTFDFDIISILMLMLNHHLYLKLNHLTLLTLNLETLYGASSKFGELLLIVASSNIQFNSNDYNENHAFGIGIKPTKNINLTKC